MKLFLIENDLTDIETLLGTGDRILCFNYLPYLRFQQNGNAEKTIFVEELFSVEDCHELHKITDSFATTWYQTDGGDLSVHNGISYGEITSIMFNTKYMVGVLVKYGEAIRKAVTLFSPDDIYCDFSDEHNFFHLYSDDKGRFFSKTRLVASVCSQLKRELTFVNCAKPIPSAHLGTINPTVHKTSSIRPRLKSYLKSSITSLLVVLWNPVNEFFLKRKKRIYFENYFNIAGLTDAKGAHFFLLAFNNRRQLFQGHSVINAENSSENLSNADREFLNGLSQKLLDAQSEVAQYIFNGIDYSTFYRRAIAQICSHNIPKLISFHNDFARKLSEHQIDIMIGYDAFTEMSQIKKETCKKIGVSYAFLDHGIQALRPQSSLVKLLDFDMVFTAGSYDPYESNRSYLSLGSPNMDIYPALRRKTVKVINKIMFLTFEDNFYARLDRFAYQEKYLAEIIPLFPILANMEIQVFYRTHFENRAYHDHVFDFFQVTDVNFEFVNTASHPFREQIYEMDLLVSNVSSCFFEAQAAGVPTIFFEPEVIEGAQALPLCGKNWDEVIRISTGKELLEVIERNKNDATELREFLENFLRVHAPKYMGPLDGKSGQRIIDYLIASPN